MPNGIVYLVGAGPGDPSLITLRGVECLQKAQVVVYDYLANEQLLNHAPVQAERIYAGKIGGKHNQDQSEINQLLVSKASEGKTVVRLKGGDPFVFGRGGEECEALHSAGIPFEIIPGVTAAIGASAYAGIPLTHRDVTASVTFVTGQEGKNKEDSALDWGKLALGNDTVVFYMGVTNLHNNMQKLIDNGRSHKTPVALVRWATMPNQQVLIGTISDIAEKAQQASFKPPAVTIVGEVVNLRDKLRWFDLRPLSGRTIIVTRAAEQASEFSTHLSAYGATVLECPTIQICDPESWDGIDQELNNLHSYDWLIFTSVNAVKYFFNRLHHNKLDSRALGSTKICAVGPQTADSIKSFGVIPDLVPNDYKAEGVVAAFELLGVSGLHVLFPCADLARDIIPKRLADLGATVTAPVIYRNIFPERLCPETIFALEKRIVDCITFTSSSTVKNLSRMLGAELFVTMLQGVTVASIGPITSRTCRELGLKVDIEPDEYTLTALASSIASHLNSTNKCNFSRPFPHFLT